jgi:regulator of nucleoside diphosphate kinase
MESENLILSDQDYARLSMLSDQGLLRDELGKATVVSADQVPGDVVIMNSRVTYLDHSTGLSRDIELCFPLEADIKAGKISVFSPVGTALLGLKVGQEIDWPFPNGESRRLKVMHVIHAP